MTCHHCGAAFPYRTCALCGQDVCLRCTMDQTSCTPLHKDKPMSFMTEVVNPWLQGHLADTIVNALQDVVHGTEADLREVAVHIAKDLTLALIRGDKEWSAELGEQVRVLFEIKKIRLSKRERALIQRRIWSLATAALKAFMAGTVQGLFQGIAPVDPAGAGVITQARTLLGL